VFEALNDLTQNNGFKFEGPEFTSGFTPDVQTLNLRGTGVGTTLVLVNGRRLTNYPAAYQSSTMVFNYGAIPAAAVERIEILATGASAIYGSDAIAGVVNIILRNDINDTNVNLLYSEPTEASGSPGTSRIQLLTGKLWERGSITAAFEYQDRDPILGKQFDEYDSDLDFPFGQGIRNRAILNLNLWDFYFGDFTTSYQDPGEGTCEGLNNGTVRDFRDERGYFCGYDAAGETNFRNGREHYSVFVNGQFDLTDNINVFADVLYYGSESTSNEWALSIGTNIFDSNDIVDTPFGPFPNWYSANRRFTEQELGRSLETTYEDDALTVSVGTRGYWRDSHEWELTFTHSQYEFNSAFTWWKAEEVINVFFGDYLGVGFDGDEWWSGSGSFGLAENLLSPIDLDLVNSAIGESTYGNETESQLAQFTLSGDLADMKNGPLSYALVLEYETQDFSFIPDERIQQSPVAPFTQGSGWYNLTGYDGAGDRERSALGGELRVPVLETLTLNLAARVDDYDSVSSSIGTRTTPSASLEWRPNEKILFRAGYTESFRAPDLNYVYTRTGFFTSATDLIQCLQFYEFSEGTTAGFDTADCESGSVFAFRTGAARLEGENVGEELKDETGWSKWVGVSFEPIEDMSIQIDLSKIRLEDRVRRESLQDILDDEYLCFIGDLSGDRCDYAAARIQRDTDGTTGVSFVTEFNASPENRAQEEVTSLDVAFNYRFDTNFGDFGIRSEYTHMFSHKFADSPGDELVDVRDDPFLGGWEFRSIWTGTLGYNYKDFSTALTWIRRGGTTVGGFGPGTIAFDRIDASDDWVEPYITWNWTAGYEITDSIDARVRVQNLFDVGPPKDNTYQFYEYPWYNTFVYPGAGLGRQAALELNLRFD
jgi:outer membrane receptor protein involved in Fe transport